MTGARPEDTIVAVARDTDAPVHVESTLLASAEREVRASLTVGQYALALGEYAVELGSRVSAGDLLLRFEAPNLLSREAQERAMLHLLEGQLADAQARGHASEAEAHRVAQGRATLDSYRLLIRELEVRSPIAGIVAELPPIPNSGQRVTVARIVRVEPLRIEVFVPFGDRLPTPGAPITIRAGSLALTGRVRLRAPMADPDGRIMIAIEIPSANGAVPGIRASASLAIGHRQGIFIPASALIAAAQPSVLVTTAEGTVIPRPVHVVSTTADGGEIEILRVLAGERIIHHAEAWFVRARGAPAPFPEDDLE